jgi:hypothetical protein
MTGGDVVQFAFAHGARVALMHVLCSHSQRKIQHAMSCFQTYDLDRNGTITLSEFIQVLRAMGHLVGYVRHLPHRGLTTPSHAPQHLT